VTVSGAGNTIFNGVIQNSNAGSTGVLAYSGTGNITLSGANTFNGGITLSSGTLNINNSGSGGTSSALGTGTLTISGGTIDNTSNSAVTLSTNNAQSWTGDFAFTGTNNLNLGSGSVTMSATRLVTVGGSSLTLNGTIDLNSSSSASRRLTVNGAGNAIFNGVIQNSFASSTGSLTYNGTGSMTLAGANTFNGGITLNSGTLNINNSGSGGTSSALGTGTLTISGGTIDNTSGSTVTLSTSNAQNWNSDFTFTGTKDLNMGAGAVTMNSNRIVTVNGGNLTIGGAISGSTASFTLTKAGAGKLILGGANAYTGTTTINAGTLSLESGGSLSSTTISVASGATFDLTAKSSGYSLGNGATLNGLGSVTTASGQSLSIGTGASIAPGTSSTSGTLTVGGLTFASGGTYAFTMGSATGTSGADWDLISVSNNFDISATSASTFTISINGNSGVPTGFSNSNNYSWDILRLNSGSITGFSADKFLFNNSISGITGEFSISANNTVLTLNYAAGSANAVYWNSSSSAWLTTSNWSSNATATGAQVAQFGANSNSASSIAINMNSGSTNNGANNQIVGAIEMTSGRTSNLSIINSSTVANGTLTLNGTTISSVNNVVLRSTSSSNLTIESISGANKAMSLALANTENVIVINGSGGITINSTISGIGKNLTLQGTGTGSLTLAGSNTYTGTTTINSGTLRMGANDVFDGSSSILIAGGTLQTSTFNDTVNAFTITSGTLAGTGTLTASTYALQGGTVNANLGTGTITVSSGTTTLSGTAAATTININSGNLTLGAANRLADTAAVTVNAALNLGGFNETIGALSGNSSGRVALGAGTLTTDSSTNTAFAGTISGSGRLTKTGSGNLTLSGSNAYTGNTTINSGTLRAATAGALGQTSTVIVNNGGSFLVTADDAIGTNTGINLDSGNTTPGLVFSGNYDGHVGALTLSADSIIDLGTSSVRLIFASIAGLANYNLSIWNWSGNTQWSGSPGGGTDQLSFTDASGLNGNLSRISFYSDLGQSLISNNAFTVGSNPTEIIAVPEPGLIITGAALLAFLLFRLARQPREANRAEKA
jgi:autotransporter-associated beta strand protein